MRSVSASPRVAGCALDPDTRRTARSASGSAPTTSKRDCSPVVNSALPPSAYATTWALVSISPSGVNTTPEPAPSPRRLRTVRLATLGSTVVATVDTTRLYASRASVSWSRSMSGGNAGTSAVDAVPGFAQRHFARKWTTWQASTRVQGVAGRSPPVRSRVRAATAAYPGRYAARSWSPRYVATATTSRTWTRCATRAPGGRSTGWAAGTSG